MRAFLSLLVVSAVAVAGEPPCTPVSPTASVEVNFKKGTSKLVDVAAWYSKVTCRELEAPLTIAEVPLGLTLEGKVPVSRIVDVIRAAAGSAGFVVREESQRVRLEKPTERDDAPPSALSVGTECVIDPSGFVASGDTVKVATKKVKNFDMDCFMRAARVVPAFKEGKVQGLKLFAIRPNSVFALIGVENGDTVKAVNGRVFDSPEKALEAYSALRNEKKFTVVVERRGEPKTLQVLLE